MKVDQTYTTPYETHNPMEMHATTAVWQGPHHLTVYDSTQGIFEVRRKVAASLGLPKENVRVISKYVGGGFGSKGSCWSHVVIAALAARQVKRPVKLMVSRPQMFGPVGFRPATRQRVVLGADRSGRLTVIRHESASVTSRFDEFVEHTTAPTRALYACPNVFTSERLVPVDTGTPQFMRAPGESTGSFAVESAMDELALRAGHRSARAAPAQPRRDRSRDGQALVVEVARGLLPAGCRAVRLAAARPAAALDETTAACWWGGALATATYPAHQRAASAAGDAAEGRPDRRDGRLAGHRHRDVHRDDAGGGRDAGCAACAGRVRPGGHRHARDADLGRIDHRGQRRLGGPPGVRGAPRKAGGADRRGCRVRRWRGRRRPRLRLDGDAVTLAAGATGPAPTGAAPAASGWPSPSNAITWRRWRLGPRPSRSKDARSARRDPSGRIWRKCASIRTSARCGWPVSSAPSRPDASSMPRPRAVSSWAASCGASGWGCWSRPSTTSGSARIVNADLAEYHVPVHRDTPDIDVIFVEEKDDHVNQVGVKGIGEIGITGMAAAVANAVFHATGKRIRDLPITLDKVLAASPG